MKWEKDILGSGFEKTYVDMGRDYAGAARCTVVRLHDLVLSRPKVRAEVYDAIFRWLREKGL